MTALTPFPVLDMLIAWGWGDMEQTRIPEPAIAAAKDAAAGVNVDPVLAEPVLATGAVERRESRAVKRAASQTRCAARKAQWRRDWYALHCGASMGTEEPCKSMAAALRQLRQGARTGVYAVSSRVFRVSHEGGAYIIEVWRNANRQIELVERFNDIAKVVTGYLMRERNQ